MPYPTSFFFFVLAVGVVVIVITTLSNMRKTLDRDLNEALLQISPERCEDFASGGVCVSV